jgi:hypothetical protein
MVGMGAQMIREIRINPILKKGSLYRKIQRIIVLDTTQ